MEIRRPFMMQVSHDIDELAMMFRQAGHALFVVGGAVRDAVMGNEPKDFDLATDALPTRVVELLNGNHGWSAGGVGQAFGIVIASRGDVSYEIATFREDIGAGRRPDAVRFTTIEDDVKRRDLTINALFYDLTKQEIVDFVGGLNDIKNGVIRAVGNPKERFDEDRLRVLRAVRFAARFNFIIDEQTIHAIHSCGQFDGISPERIRDEFVRGIASARNVDNFFELFNNFNLWKQMFTGLLVLEPPSHAGRDLSVLLASLLNLNNPKLVSSRLSELKYTQQESTQAGLLVGLKGLDATNAYRMHRALDRAGVSREQLLGYTARRWAAPSRCLLAFEQYSPTVRASDVMAEGYSGAALGKELERRETELFERLVEAVE